MARDVLLGALTVGLLVIIVSPSSWQDAPILTGLVAMGAVLAVGFMLRSHRRSHERFESGVGLAAIPAGLVIQTNAFSRVAIWRWDEVYSVDLKGDLRGTMLTIEAGKYRSVYQLPCPNREMYEAVIQHVQRYAPHVEVKW